MSVTRAARRGVTAAVHSDAQLLTPAAAVDLIGEVRSLLEQGRHADAAALWASVAEVVHLPIPELQVKEFAELPPVRRIPCCVVDCQRCSERRGGYRFPWLGQWCRWHVVVRPGASPLEAWDALAEDGTKMDIARVEMFASGYSLGDLMPKEWDALLAKAVDAPGCATQHSIYMAFRTWQLGHDLWRDPRTSTASRTEAIRSPEGRAQRALAGWLQFLVAEPDFHLPASCFTCGSLTRQMCTGCLVSFCHTCTEARIDPMCCEEARCAGDIRLDMPPLRHGERTGHIIQQLIRQYGPAAAREQWWTSSTGHRSSDPAGCMVGWPPCSPVHGSITRKAGGWSSEVARSRCHTTSGSPPIGYMADDPRARGGRRLRFYLRGLPPSPCSSWPSRRRRLDEGACWSPGWHASRSGSSSGWLSCQAPSGYQILGYSLPPSSRCSSPTPQHCRGTTGNSGSGHSTPTSVADCRGTAASWALDSIPTPRLGGGVFEDGTEARHGSRGGHREQLPAHISWTVEVPAGAGAGTSSGSCRSRRVSAYRHSSAYPSTDIP